jgi:hypothetical protein
LENDTAIEIFGWSIVCISSINKEWRKCVGQSVDIDSMEIVNAIRDSCVASNPEVWNVRLGEKIDDIGSWVNDRCSSDSDGVWDVYAMSAPSLKT